MQVPGGFPELQQPRIYKTIDAEVVLFVGVNWFSQRTRPELAQPTESFFRREIEVLIRGVSETTNRERNVTANREPEPYRFRVNSSFLDWFSIFISLMSKISTQRKLSVGTRILYQL